MTREIISVQLSGRDVWFPRYFHRDNIAMIIWRETYGIDLNLVVKNIKTKCIHTSQYIRRYVLESLIKTKF